jgi:predicted kinase
MPLLYIFSGLPGTGKSTIAKGLSKTFGCTYLRIDTIEQALRDLCGFTVEGEGYRMAYRLAQDNLKQGLSVVADSCNPILLTRQEWQNVASDAEVPFINIEIICTDPLEHKDRIETRLSDISTLALPSWEEVQNREYDTWSCNRIVIDTAGKTPVQSINELLAMLESTHESDRQSN